ncbi:MAG: hypothetical protein M3313_03045 [Actinomycetota bacterium]|nr:hypothetical protein [Actinomycetota bacterium]
MARIRVYTEATAKRAFACALDWPGWARAARTEDLAIKSLADYAPRYAPVAAIAGLRWPAALDFEVVERLTGSGSTEFGVLDKPPKADAEKITPLAAGRQASLLQASWQLFDDIVANAPAALRKGPRGGGRNRDKIVEHVVGAEASYARMIGIRDDPKTSDLSPAAAARRRERVLAVLSAASDGGPLRDKGWPTRYALRRFAWHVLDHAWEIEDKSDRG